MQCWIIIYPIMHHSLGHKFIACPCSLMGEEISEAKEIASQEHQAPEEKKGSSAVEQVRHNEFFYKWKKLI